MRKVPLSIGLITAMFLPQAGFAQSASDHLAICSGSNSPDCQINRKKFSDEFPRAYRKDYGAQRNIAYCLASGCGGAVQENATLACAWRMVIASSGSSKVGDGDVGNLKVDCGKLDDVQRSIATQQYKKIAARLK